MGDAESPYIQRAKNTEEPEVASRTQEQWIPGPDMKSPGWGYLFSILGYAKIQIFIMLVALVTLVDLILKWDVMRPPMQSINIIDVFRGICYVLFQSPIFFHDALISPKNPSNWIDWWLRVQSFLGLGTLLVALFLWCGKIREEWLNQLPKRMSVFFLHDGWPAIVCRYIWLAGEDDLRAWGQQVAAQAAPQRFLNFYPNIKAERPVLIRWKDGTICRHYVVSFELIDNKPDDNPFIYKYLGMCRYQNMSSGSNDVYSVPLNDLKKKVPASIFPFKWPDQPKIYKEGGARPKPDPIVASINSMNENLGKKMDVLTEKQDHMQHLQRDLISEVKGSKKGLQ